MKKLSKLGILALTLMTLVVMSCSDENDKTNQQNLTLNQTLKNAVAAARAANSSTSSSNTSTEDPDYGDDCIEDYLCFDFVYPLTVIAEDNSQTTVNNDDELFTFFENQSDNYEPNFVYPITLDYGEDDTEIMYDLEDLEDAFDDCEENFECFDIIYPITLVDSNGTNTVINNEEELYTFLDAQGEEYDPIVVYPVDVMVDDVTLTINSDDEFETLYEECDDDWDDVICFDFVYPFDMISNGVTTNVPDEDTFFDYIEGLEDEEDVDFVYPLTLIDEDTGNTVIVNSLDEFEELFDSCEDEWED